MTSFSHVRLRWTLKNRQEVIYEAAGSNVRFLGEIAQLDTPVKVCKSYCMELTDNEYRQLLNKAIELAGIEYGAFQLIRMALFRFFKRKLSVYKDKKTSIVCSELVIYILKEALKIKIDIDPDLAGPRELDILLDNLYNSKNSILRLGALE